jgi:hypothetical protein
MDRRPGLRKDPHLRCAGVKFPVDHKAGLRAMEVIDAARALEGMAHALRP